jgi:iron complex transport system substrate-binding protein
MRIVSLLPSATEIVCSLGLQDQLVGVTHECDYPSGVVELPKVTKTIIPDGVSSREIDGLVQEKIQTGNSLYSLDTRLLQQLQADLIVTQTLCDVCAVAEADILSAVRSLKVAPRIVTLEPTRLKEVFDAIALVGEATKRVPAAEILIARLQQRVDVVASRQVGQRPRVLLLEWIDPPFCAGHWSPELVRLAGGEEVVGDQGRPSRSFNWSEVVAADPDVLVIACCGYTVERSLADLPILRRYPEWTGLRCVRDDRVFVVDGSAYFNRPGPRLVDSLEILAHALHPQIHPLPSGLSPAIRAASG